MTFDEWFKTDSCRGRAWILLRDAYEAGAASVGHTDCLARMDASNWRCAAKLVGEQLKTTEYERDAERERAERERAEKAEKERDAALARVKELESDPEKLHAERAAREGRSVAKLLAYVELRQELTEAEERAERAESERDEMRRVYDSLNVELRKLASGEKLAEYVERVKERDAALAKVKELEAECDGREESQRSLESALRDEEKRAERAESERDAARAQVAALREELDKHHGSGCSQFGGYDCDCRLEALFASAPKGKP